MTGVQTCALPISPSVASGLQRVGRAGHNVGDVSRGIIFPKYQGDLVQSAVVAERMRAGAIEELKIPHNPLDVLAQQIVAMTAVDDWRVDDLEQMVRRAAMASAHGACTRSPYGLCSTTRQSPSSSRNRSTTRVRSSGT